MEYSGIEHIAKSVLFENWRRSYWMMITGYFDESCTDAGKRFSVVSGVLSSFDVWDIFEDQWDAVLTEYNLEAFHMADFAAGRLETKSATSLGPDSNGLEAFNELTNIAVKHTLWGFSCGADNNILIRYGLPRSYQLCSMVCCYAVDTWANEKGIKLPIGFVFDHGNKHRYDFDRGYIEASKRGILSQKLQGSVSFANHRTVKPLQVADILAWLKGRKGNATLPEWAEECDKRLGQLMIGDGKLDEQIIKQVFNAKAEKQYPQI